MCLRLQLHNDTDLSQRLQACVCDVAHIVASIAWQNGLDKAFKDRLLLTGPPMVW